MRAVLLAFVSGLLFGLGLVISHMADPAKVIGFLDISGNWDPSLALVMAAGLTVSALGYQAIRRRAAPVLASKVEIPTRRDLDARLVVGSGLFGIGWGLAGFCPGPALAALPLGSASALLFVPAMLAGMAVHRIARAMRTPSH